MGPEKIVIKRYGNRRLYDTYHSRYINLDQLANLIRSGTEVHVLDAKSGRDVTRVTLTQIIVEEAKQEPAGLPIELLRQLIMASAQVRQEFMKQALATYGKMQTAMQTGLAGVRQAAMSPLEIITRIFDKTVAERRDERNELDELRRRLAQLESQVKKPTGKGKARVS